MGDNISSHATSRRTANWNNMSEVGLAGPQRESSYGRNPSNSSSTERRRSFTRAPKGKKWWKFTLQPWDDKQKSDWWFAGTAIPLLAATIGPLANVLSIAALVTPWRMCLVDGVEPSACTWDGGDLLGDLDGHTYADPRWIYVLNIVSLIMGFVGNLFLLFNFTNRIRYIVALPLTILLWYAATAILIGIEISMNIHVPPIGPHQTYTQGFWYAVIAAVLYLVCSMLLMINMLGYFLGHYPQKFNLTDSQRTLILQTMLFFIWLAGGAAVFSTIESKYGDGLFRWSYVNSLYYCDVTILTVGFGDLYPSSSAGRGLVLPYSIGGIIMLGLVISSITKFATELGEDKVLQRHVERSRSRTISRTVTNSMELKDRERFLARETKPIISAPFDPVNRSIQFSNTDRRSTDTSESPILSAFKRTAMPLTALRPTRKPRLLLLREEKDRFDAMRRIQHSTDSWKKWSALLISISAFSILWCIGALIFWFAERKVQGITYFESLYLCYVSLLTIGYGDLAPKSNAGRPFFVVWSLVAVPTMTILVADMGDTIISGFKQGTFRLADFTILPKQGIWHGFLPHMISPFLQRHGDRKAARNRLKQGFQAGIPPPTIDDMAREEESRKPSNTELARKLSHAIQRTAKDLMATPPKSYSYEEWVQVTKLIRFTAREGDGDEEGSLIEWDWIGKDSPMMAQQSEAEFVLDRLCESMGRYLRNVAAREEGAAGEGRDRQRGFSEPTLGELEEEIAEA